MIVHGECVELMRGLDECSVDAIVTDPPYGLGFMGKEWDDLPPGDEFAREALRVLKPGGHLLAFGGTRTYHRLACAVEDAGFEIRDCLAWLYGSGFPKSRNLDGEWQGWGTALKPAHEPIVMARKPLDGTVAANVLEHGTGALNVDGCRIALDGERAPTGSGDRRGSDKYAQDEWTRTRMANGGNETPPEGRWPANVALDGDTARMLDEQTGDLPAGVAVRRHKGYVASNNVSFTQSNPEMREDVGYADTGGASRFFYCAKASKRERNAGLDGFEEKPAEVKNASGRGFSERNPYAEIKRQNTHPTVKPVDLMRWLCRLVTPPRGLILDPFTGSGTTGIAATLEGFDFLGFEREAEYVEIARARIDHATNEAVQLDLEAA